MEEKKLLIFPLISGLIMIGTFVIFFVPSLLVSEGEIGSGISLILLAAYYFASYFVVIFFNSALVHAAKNKLDGNPVSLTQSIGFAASRIVNIVIWAAIAATVGMILSILRSDSDRRGGLLGVVGWVVASIIGATWSIVTYFVIPIMVFENVNPIEAIGRSFSLIKKTWGEQIIGGLGIGGIFLIAYVLGIVLGLGMIFMGGAIGIALGIGFLVLYFVTLGLIQSTMQAIFVTALYNYATIGQRGVFEDRQLKEAFKAK